MTDADKVAVTADLLDEIRGTMDVPLDDPRLPWTSDDVDNYVDFIAGSQTDLKTEVLDNVTRRYGERIEYLLRGAWRAGYDYVHVYESGPELARAGLEPSFTFHRDYVPSNNPPSKGRAYKFSYDISGVPDDVLRAAIRGDIDVETSRAEVRDRG